MTVQRALEELIEDECVEITVKTFETAQCYLTKEMWQAFKESEQYNPDLSIDELLQVCGEWLYWEDNDNFVNALECNYSVDTVEVDY